MSGYPEQASLAELARHVEGLRWSAMILDGDWGIAWVSDELKEFMQTSDETELGYGLHVVEAFVQPTWFDSVTPESQIAILSELGPYVVHDFAERGRDASVSLPPPLAGLAEQMTPVPAPDVWSFNFQYVRPGGDPEQPSTPVGALAVRLRDSGGDSQGWLINFFIGVRPNLVRLLASGDSDMFERMAGLIDPGPRQAAILFCDLAASGELSRRLSSAAYFRLVRRLWTAIDGIVADQTGIVGKHAGDGATAYFLTDDLGSPSAAAGAALRAARRVHELSEEVFQDSLGESCAMKVGLHWGGSLYMGQLVPGGRLEVTALGDEVNEAARVQETAAAGTTLVSKQLLEHLQPGAAVELGLDVDKLGYRPLGDFPAASDKARRDAGTLAVAEFSS